MNPKFLITSIFIGATVGAAIKPDESVTPDLERRDWHSCYQTCLGHNINKYDHDTIIKICTAACARHKGAVFR
ncbi:hypothetical protein LX36DRAFT_662851 [Colletotrichum falcatum]|nr:hypothetical protein LX36DRAFT_662851 [Colletotrichum falcatum]